MKPSYAKSPKLKPKVGMGVTRSINSDSYAYEIIEVQDEKHCTVRSLDHTPDHSDPSGDKYKFTSNPNGEIERLVFRYGRWRSLVKKVQTVRDKDGNPVLDEHGHMKYETVFTKSLELPCVHWNLGKAVFYLDPSF